MRAELLRPAEIYEVTVTLPSTALTFLKGHRIRIIFSSANWPRFEANANIDRTRVLRKRAVATNHVFHDGEHLSALELPTISIKAKRSKNL